MNRLHTEIDKSYGTLRTKLNCRIILLRDFQKYVAVLVFGTRERILNIICERNPNWVHLRFMGGPTEVPAMSEYSLQN